MKQKAALFCLSLFMGTSLWAENAEKKGVESINRLTAEAHVEFLASEHSFFSPFYSAEIRFFFTIVYKGLSVYF